MESIIEINGCSHPLYAVSKMQSFAANLSLALRSFALLLHLTHNIHPIEQRNAIA